MAAAERIDVSEIDARILPIVAMAQPIERSGSVMDGVRRAAPLVDRDPVAELRLGIAAHAVGDFEQSLRILPLAIEMLRAQGRLGDLTHAVGMFASEAVFVGDWPVAEGAAAEFALLARETNQPIWRAGAAVAQAAVAGARGDHARAESQLAEAQRLSSTASLSDVLTIIQNAKGVLALAAGRYEDAFAHLARVFDPDDPTHHHREKYVAVGNFSDAALLTGRQAEGRELLARLEAQAAPAVDRALLHGLWYGKALLAEDDRAEAQFGFAFDVIGPRWQFDHGRLNLAYGAWLRRRRRVTESREPLRVARDAFDQLACRRGALAPARSCAPRARPRAAGSRRTGTCSRRRS